MNDELFARRLHGLAKLESGAFTDLVRVSGLDVRSDFVEADLSGTDLRNQDLTSFDFTRARFDRALITGALFNGTVRPEQLAEAIHDLEFAVIPIGERLLAMHAQLVTFMGAKAFVPRGVREALLQLAEDPDRRRRRMGAFVGDNSDLVHRRLSKPFRAMNHTLRAAGRCLVLFEPTSDLDFDALEWVLRSLKRSNIASFVFIFPQAMNDDFGVYERRMRSMPSEDSLVFEGRAAHWKSGFVNKESRQFSQLERAHELAVGFAWAAANGKLIDPPSPSLRARTRWRSGAHPDFDIGDGRRAEREALSKAVLRELGSRKDVAAIARVCILVREDLYTDDEAAKIRAAFGAPNAQFAMATYPDRYNLEVEFYLAIGAHQSPAWAVLAPRAVA